jgi:hypothetical protein
LGTLTPVVKRESWIVHSSHSYLHKRADPFSHAPKAREENMQSTTSTPLSRGSQVLLEHTNHLPLLCRSLVHTVTELGRGVDPFELDLFQRSPARVREHGFAESHDSLLHTRARALEQDEIILDLTVADETTKTTHVS